MLVSVGLALLLAACDGDSPTRPGSVVRIEVSGPRTLEPGQAATFTATAFDTTGIADDVTDEARWRSPNFTVFRFDGPGRGLAGTRGDAPISVDLNGVTSTMQVVVVPPGTYRLSGAVTLSGFPGEPVWGALVQVLDSQERLETTTSALGRYVLFGVPAGARILITRAGYAASEQTVQLSEHQAVDFALSPLEPLPVLTGTYTLKITLATPCGDKDPGPEFRDRTYSATITHISPSSIVVRLAGADMVVSSGRGDRFTGTVEPSRVTFWIDADFYRYFYPEVVERLPDDMYLVLGGTVSTTKVTEGLIGTMNGSMRFATGQPGQNVPFAVCWSTDIRFALLK